MIDEAFLYAVGIVKHTQYVKLASKHHCTERKKSANESQAFNYRVNFKLASIFCINNRIESRGRIKRVFRQYGCEEHYTVFIRLCKKYPLLMRKLKYKGVLPRNSEVVKRDFYKLYSDNKVYIAKYVRKKLGILKKNYRSYEDIENSFIPNLLLAYYKVFLNPNKKYVANYFRSAIRNHGKWLLSTFSRKKRSEFNNILTGKETKIQECQISEALEAVLASPEVEDSSELTRYIENGTSIGARICRIIIGDPEERYHKWLKLNKIKLSVAKKNPVFYARDYFNINEPTWQKFLNEFRESFL